MGIQELGSRPFLGKIWKNKVQKYPKNIGIILKRRKNSRRLEKKDISRNIKVQEETLS